MMGFTGGNNGNYDTTGFSFPIRNLSVWWSEETEYLLQRIERWAAYARGYNRLRSARLSPGRMTMQESGWGRESPPLRTRITATTTTVNASNNNRGTVTSTPVTERQSLRCCALDYKSNANLDSRCLEAYSLDHSIYFKTIGEIRNEQLRSNAIDDNNDNVDDDDLNVNVDVNDSIKMRKTTNRTRRTQQLDCGDFLASDFDELDDEVEDSDLEALGEELREQLEAACAECDQRPDVVQVCRSVINEDEINNNFTLVGYPRNNKFINVATPPAQLYHPSAAATAVAQ